MERKGNMREELKAKVEQLSEAQALALLQFLLRLAEQ
jgi:hypothetical protein